MNAAGCQRHKSLYLEHDLHREDGRENIIGVTEYLQVKETSVSRDSGVSLLRGCVEQTTPLPGSV